MTELGCRAPEAAVRILFEVCRSPIVDCAHGGLRFQVKGIVAREAHLDEALATLHGIEAGADEVAVKEDISRSGEEADVGKSRLENLGATANGFEIQFAGALRADQRAFRGADNDVAGNFPKVNFACDAFQGHVAHDLLDVNQSRLGLELQLRFFRNSELQISCQLGGLCRGVQNIGGDVDAVAGLLHVEANFVGSLAGENVDFGVFPGFHFDAAIGDVVNYNHWAGIDRKMLFEVLTGGCRASGRQTRAEKSSGSQKRQHAAIQILSQRAEPQDSNSHVSGDSLRDPSSRKVIRLFVDMRWTGIRAPARPAVRLLNGARS